MKKGILVLSIAIILLSLITACAAEPEIVEESWLLGKWERTSWWIIEDEQLLQNNQEYVIEFLENNTRNVYRSGEFAYTSLYEIFEGNVLLLSVDGTRVTDMHRDGDKLYIIHDDFVHEIYEKIESIEDNDGGEQSAD